MKRPFSILIVLVILAVAATAFAASGSINMPSTPSAIKVYSANNWSDIGYFDMTNNTTMAAGATVAGIYIWCDTSQTGKFTGEHFVVKNAAGTTVNVTRGVRTDAFNGQLAKQKWATQFYVTGLTQSPL